MGRSSAGAVERWLAARRRLVLAGIIAASAAIRGAYFLELNSGPCIWQHRWEPTDMHFFDAWARRIAGGDWLTDIALHP